MRIEKKDTNKLIKWNILKASSLLSYKTLFLVRYSANESFGVTSRRSGVGYQLVDIFHSKIRVSCQIHRFRTFLNS